MIGSSAPQAGVAPPVASVGGNDRLFAQAEMDEFIRQLEQSPSRNDTFRAFCYLCSKLKAADVDLLRNILCAEDPTSRPRKRSRSLVDSGGSHHCGSVDVMKLRLILLDHPAKRVNHGQWRNDNLESQFMAPPLNDANPTGPDLEDAFLAQDAAAGDYSSVRDNAKVLTLLQAQVGYCRSLL
jgi:hypothetical protein